MSAVELIEYALRDTEVPMSDMLARAFDQIESDLATAEQDSRQKQARIERLESALRLIADTDPVDAALDPQRAVRVARDALEETK